MLFYYIRHGEPLGVPDYSLTPLGREQAKALAKRLCLFGIDRVFASPTLRTMQTAQPICDLLGKEITPCDWADEGIVWNEFTVPHPKYEHTWAFFDPKYLEIFSSPEVRALGECWYEHPELAGLNFKAGVERVNAAVDEFFLSLGFRHDRENARYEVVGEHLNRDRVALFAHQGFGMLFFSSLLDIPYHLDREYTYYVPATLWAEPSPRGFVLVPFGGANKKHTALITSLGETDDYEKLKPVLALINEPLTLTEEMMALVRFLVDRTLCSFGDAVRRLIPADAFARADEYYSLRETHALPTSAGGLNEKSAKIVDFLSARSAVRAERIEKEFGAAACDKICHGNALRLFKEVIG